MFMVAAFLVVVRQQHGNAEVYTYDDWLTGMFILSLAGELIRRCGPVWTETLMAKKLSGS
jgi:hypothetical protein